MRSLLEINVCFFVKKRLSLTLKKDLWKKLKTFLNRQKNSSKRSFQELGNSSQMQKNNDIWVIFCGLHYHINLWQSGYRQHIHRDTNSHWFPCKYWQKNGALEILSSQKYCFQPSLFRYFCFGSGQVSEEDIIFRQENHQRMDECNW